MSTDQKHGDNIRQFEALFNYATIGIVVTGNTGKIINFNKYAEIQFGYTKEEVLGQPVEILIPTRVHTSHNHHREGFYHHPEQKRMGEGRDLFARKKNGDEFPVEISLTYYHMGKETLVIAFVIDITVRKKGEVEVLRQKQELEKVATQVKQMNIELEQKVGDRTKMLRETLAQLEKSKDELSDALEKEKELNELKSRFVTMASHEFRTPLSTILSSAFLLEKYNETSTEKKSGKHIQRIKTAVDGMKSILEDFLSLGKLEEGSIKAVIETLSAGECFTEMEETINEMEQLLKPGQRIHSQHNGNANVRIDKHLLKNILINLISNAIKFSPEGSEIQIICSITNELMSVTVKDSGIGISEEDQQHLFQRFFRAKNAANIQGTGLGLHIVTKYLELMNGNISMQSKLNEGTTFIISIPQSS